VPWMEHAVTESAGMPRRWHYAAARPVQEFGATLTGLELLLLPGLSDGTSVLRAELVLAPDSPVMSFAPGYHNLAPVEIDTALGLGTVWGGHHLRTGWGTSPVQRPLSRPPAVAELFCTTIDDPSLLPEPSLRLHPQPWSEADYRMYTMTRDDAEPTPEDVDDRIKDIFPIGGGVAMVGGYRSAVMADFGWGTSARRFAVDAMFYAVAQNVMLKRLVEQAEMLVEPTRNPNAAIALSRGVLAYRAVFWWDGTGRPEPEARLVRTYRQENGLAKLETDLSSFETAAQAMISAQTNVLLGLVTVLGLAVAVAAAVVQAAGWKGGETLWGVLIALIVAAGLLMLPTGRALRQSIIRR
jgi:hypothetical protein